MNLISLCFIGFSPFLSFCHATSTPIIATSTPIDTASDTPVLAPVTTEISQPGMGIISGGAYILNIGTVLGSPYSKYVMTIGENGSATYTLNPDFKG